MMRQGVLDTGFAGLGVGYSSEVDLLLRPLVSSRDSPII